MNSLASFLAFLIGAGTVSIATHEPPAPPPPRACWTYEQAKAMYEKWEPFDKEMGASLKLQPPSPRFFYGKNDCVFWRDENELTEADRSKLRPAP